MKKYKCRECQGNCYGCFYTDMCSQWLDESPYEPYYEVSDHASMALCDGRHQATLQDFIKAMEIAKLKELQNFFKSKSLFFEDGYIKVITR